MSFCLIDSAKVRRFWEMEKYLLDFIDDAKVRQFWKIGKYLAVF